MRGLPVVFPNMTKPENITIPITRSTPLSLNWRDGQLIDWVRGGDTYDLDGTFHSSNFALGYNFDAAIVSPSGRFQVIYQKLGTKGVLMEGNKLLREIDRSYYFANAYEFPIVLFELPDGREVMAHCPDEYCQLEIEEIETGKRLTQREGEPMDFFHSRLAVSKNGQYLMSAGWIWHPVDWVEIFDIQQCLQYPADLDKEKKLLDSSSEMNNACFLGDNEIILHSAIEAEDFDEGEPEEERRSPMRPGTVGVFNLTSKTWKYVVPVAANIGTMFLVDENHVLGVYEHPKLVEIATGAIVREWPELETGKQNSSIIWGIDPVPPMAYDAQSQRLAVVQDKRIEVITIPVYK
jgi:hypothetical protein